MKKHIQKLELKGESAQKIRVEQTDGPTDLTGSFTFPANELYYRNLQTA